MTQMLSTMKDHPVRERLGFNLKDRLPGGRYHLCPPSNGHTFIVQTDGDLVECSSFGQDLGVRYTAGERGNYRVVHSDGHLAFYSSSRQARWASDVYGISGDSTYLSLQNDSNVVPYDSGSALRWFSPRTSAKENLFHLGWSIVQWNDRYMLRTDERGWCWYVCDDYPFRPYFPNYLYHSYLRSSSVLSGIEDGLCSS